MREPYGITSEPLHTLEAMLSHLPAWQAWCAEDSLFPEDPDPEDVPTAAAAYIYQLYAPEWALRNRSLHAGVYTTGSLTARSTAESADGTDYWDNGVVLLEIRRNIPESLMPQAGKGKSTDSRDWGDAWMDFAGWQEEVDEEEVTGGIGAILEQLLARNEDGDLVINQADVLEIGPLNDEEGVVRGLAFMARIAIHWGVRFR